jgi:predicted HicB family RNase H-like nuclease
MATKAKLDANDRYLKKQDSFLVRVPKGEKARIEEYAKGHDQSLNSFIVQLIKKAMEE